MSLPASPISVIALTSLGFALVACSDAVDASRPTSPPTTTHKDAGTKAPKPDGGGSSTTPDGGVIGDDDDDDTDSAVADDSARPGWNLVWRDEFNGANGSAVDPTKWQHETGNSGW